MKSGFLGKLGLFLFALSVSATTRLTKINHDEFSKHRLTPPPVIHERLPPGYTSLEIFVDVVARTSGLVETATTANISRHLPKWATDEAETAERSQQFKPFKRRGHPVRATSQDIVWIVPPVEWASPRVLFPEIHDWASLRIKLSRTYCYGVCPVYSLEIRGDGEVVFNGQANVPALGGQRGRVSRKIVSDLVEAFRRAEYFSLKDEYVATITDLPSCTTSIEFDGQKKAVKDYVGFAAGMPDVVVPLERKIDEVVRAKGWIR